MEPPLVSIIMPCRNAGRMLRGAVRSVIGQSYPNKELIFVHDRSNDGSVELARKFAETAATSITITCAPTAGVNSARNHGFSLARGEFVQWLDADDEIEPNKIATQVEFLLMHPDIDIAYGDWIERDYRQLTVGDRRINALSSGNPIRRALSLHWHAPHAHLLRRSAAARLSNETAFWPSRPVATDVEYFAIATLLGLKFAYVPNGCAVYNIWSETQMSSSTNYLLRAATLKNIYERLNELSNRDDIRPRIKTDHRALLNQNWDLWALPTGNIEQQRRNGRQVMLFNRRNGRSIRVRPHEAQVIPIIESPYMARFVAHHATEISLQKPGLFLDQAEIIFFLDRLRRAEILLRVTPPVPA